MSPQSPKYRRVFSTLSQGTSLSVSTILLLTGSAIASPHSPSVKQTEPPQTPELAGETRFSCDLSNGQHTVMYHPQSQPDQSYAWANPTTLGGGWTSERRCVEISRRLESYRPDGLLEMRTGLENGYNTVCVTTQQDANCRIVLTVPPGQDPLLTRDRVFENLTVADSGQQTDAVNTLTGNGQDEITSQIGQILDLDLPSLSGQRGRSSSIDLRPFLDRADGGTGARLQSDTFTPPSPRLNPGSFR